MVLSHAARHLGLGLAALALAALPLATPLFLSLGLILAGVLAAWQGAAEILALTGPAEADAVLFRHVI